MHSFPLQRRGLKPKAQNKATRDVTERMNCCRLGEHGERGPVGERRAHPFFGSSIPPLGKKANATSLRFTESQKKSVQTKPAFLWFPWVADGTDNGGRLPRASRAQQIIVKTYDYNNFCHPNSVVRLISVCFLFLLLLTLKQLQLV